MAVLLEMIQSPLDVAPEAAALAQLLAVHEQYVGGSRRPPGIGERVNTRAVQALLHARAAELTYHERTVEYISRVLEGLPKGRTKRMSMMRRKKKTTTMRKIYSTHSSFRLDTGA